MLYESTALPLSHASLYCVSLALKIRRFLTSVVLYPLGHIHYIIVFRNGNLKRHTDLSGFVLVSTGEITYHALVGNKRRIDSTDPFYGLKNLVYKKTQVRDSRRIREYDLFLLG